MGRLTEAFGYLKIKPEENTKLFRVHNLTSYTPNEEMKKIRRKLKLWDEENENNKPKLTPK